jgi:hypothetical protein
MLQAWYWNKKQQDRKARSVSESISNFEREQIALRIAQADRDAHAFCPDEREWGWFDPREWFEFVELVRPYAAGVGGE